MNGYNHKEIEQKWQKEWKDTELYNTPDKIGGKENFYLLTEFTYPSGNLHVGHWYNFALADMYGRYKRMQGFNVLFPTGFDAFGLPAENAAIKLGVDPNAFTHEQMQKMRIQLRTMGAMFDWSREVVTCEPEYYKWTQWMFNRFFENDLIYRDKTQVNWCPKDQTILANEQVIDGKCDRCGTEVVQRDQEQWMLRITKYADRLIDDLHDLDWPHAIKEAQRNWIGKSDGSEIDFRIKDSNETIRIFTTRADTIMGVTYLALAPEHPLLAKLAYANKDVVAAYVVQANKKSELDRQQSKEKTGVVLDGIVAINPANNEEVPVWIADYVLAGYGTGAVMGVPQHDERDHAFATKYGLRIVDQPLVEKDIITQKVGGKMVSTYRLRDWGISRQRYWGCPIPIVYDPEGAPHVVPDEHLPWLLPTDVDHTPDGTAPLARSKELFERTEKIFGQGWKPEVETMDAFVDSTWYFYRYLDNKNDKTFATKEKMEAWMPIDLYIGGPEHTTMHVLYSRFWTKALYDLGLVKDKEAFVIRRNRGLILGPDGNKMSKSKGNVINPDEIVDRLGTDTVRAYLAFIGPYAVPGNYPWDPNGVVGVRRFLERVWKIKNKVSVDVTTSSRVIHKAIKNMTADIEDFKFNTAISEMMIVLNAWDKESVISLNDYKMLLRLLAPFAPHIAEELWHIFGENGSIHHAQWPQADTSLIVEDSYTIGVQINGKLRTELTAKSDATKDWLQEAVLALPRVQELVGENEIKQLVIVPGRIINIVI